MSAPVPDLSAAPALSPRAGVAWVKGHGTRNDFVLLDDPDGTLFGGLDPDLVRHLCDRRDGVGADGVLRVVRAGAVGSLPGVPPLDDAVEWFMDYRNADGSVAEMCGNGVRVFAQYLLATGRVAPGVAVPVGTRSGVRTARPGRPPAPGVDPADGAADTADSAADPASGWWAVDMGTADLARYRAGGSPLTVAVHGDERVRPAAGVDVGNPHAVVFVDEVADAGDLASPPQVTPPGVFPDGVNVEFVARTGRAAFAMRVFERGAGETPSCGTGICAAAAVLHASAAGPDDAGSYAVTVPGGELTVAVSPAGPDRFAVTLAGPAVLTGEGRLTR